jgi:putative kinase
MDLVQELLSQELYLDQTAARLVIDPAEIERFYLPLAAWIAEQRAGAPRWLVAIAGPPGCGKTAFAALLAATFNLKASEPQCVVVGLDGWHFPNHYLETHFLPGDANPRTLRQVKGAPETFDAQAAFDCLQQIRAGIPTRIPLYSRHLHEPVAGAGFVPVEARLVLVEGNFWLLDEQPWRQFWQLFDRRILLTAEPETLLSGLRQRHLRGGKPPEIVERHLTEVDLPNIRRVLRGSASADVTVHKDDSYRIARLEWM